MTSSFTSGYFDEKFNVLEWITYLKRLSLIVLMLCSVVLYYVPKSRLYARKACCALIDLVANGLKFALTATETEYEKIKAKEQDENKEPRIQELYRKVCKEDTRNYGHIDKINIDDSNYKPVSKRVKRKSYIKCSAEKRERNHRLQNATFKDISSEFGAEIKDSPQIVDEELKKKNIITLHDVSSKTKIMMCNTSNRIKDDLQQEKSVKNHKNYAVENTKTESSSSEKRNPSTVQKLINKSDIECKSMCEGTYNYRDCNYNNNYLSMTNQHDKVVNDCQHQSRKDCMTRIINEQIADPHYDRVKPVLLRVVNWFFGGCPEVSRRHREQIDEVGKEEIFKSTNTWLL